jgi:hypothetical protein
VIGQTICATGVAVGLGEAVGEAVAVGLGDSVAATVGLGVEEGSGVPEDTRAYTPPPPAIASTAMAARTGREGSRGMQRILDEWRLAHIGTFGYGPVHFFTTDRRRATVAIEGHSR